MNNIISNDFIDVMLDAVGGVWDVVTSNWLLYFWAGTAVLSSGFWALRKARRLVR